MYGATKLTYLVVITNQKDAKDKINAAAERSAAAFGAGSCYFVTRSSQRTIDSMTSIDSPHAATNTAHVAHMGVWR